jgi:hypothetical protein
VPNGSNTKEVLRQSLQMISNPRVSYHLAEEATNTYLCTRKVLSKSDYQDQFIITIQEMEN